MRPLLLILPLLLSACASTPKLPPTCELKPESGQCRAAHQRYWFDTNTGQCRAFIWGGCNGVVPFETLEECQKTCESGHTPLSAPASPRRGY